MKRAHITQIKKKTHKRQIIFKIVGRISKFTFLQKRHTDGQQAHENMVNLTNYQRNANKNYNEVSRHTSQNDHHQKSLQMINAEEQGTLLHCWQECKVVQPLWKIIWSFLKKLKIELIYDPAVSLFRHISGKDRN